MGYLEIKGSGFIPSNLVVVSTYPTTADCLDILLELVVLCVHTCVCVCVCVSVCMCVSVCVCLDLCTHMYVYVHARVSVWEYVRVCACLYVCSCFTAGFNDQQNQLQQQQLLDEHNQQHQMLPPANDADQQVMDAPAGGHVRPFISLCVSLWQYSGVCQLCVALSYTHTTWR